MELKADKSNFIEITIKLMEEAEKKYKESQKKYKYVMASLNILIDDIKDEYIRNQLYLYNQKITPQIIDWIILASKGKLKINRNIKCISQCCDNNFNDGCCSIIYNKIIIYMSWILNNFYYYLGYENEIKPTPETLKQRNLVLKQVLLSSKGMREKQNKISLRKVHQMFLLSGNLPV